MAKSEHIGKTATPWIDYSLSLFQDSLKKMFPKNELNLAALFSPTCILINESVLKDMLTVIDLSQKALLKEGYSTGVCAGYDFHLTTQGIKLIEINTNAGGALLNLERFLFLQKNTQLPKGYEFCFNLETSLENVCNQFLNESNHQVVKFLAIMDKNPESQFLYPEFLLYKRKLSQHFSHVEIVSPEDLVLEKDYSLTFNGEKVDFIYNRLTDFLFEEKSNQKIKFSYENKKVIISPSAQNYESLADKKYFINLCSKDWLLSKGLKPKEAEILSSSIPKTTILNIEHKEEYWAKRKNLFFKPTHGYGSKAVYRGDKITHKVFDEICNEGNYIAQEIASPDQHMFELNHKNYKLKYDLRVYCYKTTALLVAARLYDGQTTNFRTESGGFAPVFISPFHSSKSSHLPY